MKRAAQVRFTLVIIAALCCLAVTAFADGLNNNEVEFTGAISSVAPNGEGVGTVFLSLQGFDLRVVVNSNTDLQDKDGYDIDMSALAAEQFVVVTGKYSSDGVLASSIRIVDTPSSTFELRGRITAVQASDTDTLINLHGITLKITADTTIQSDGVDVPVSSLKIGAFVQVEGHQEDSVWVADILKVRSEEPRKESVRFEGTVKSIDGDLLQIEVDGLTDTSTPVHTDTNTRIVGTLAAGQPVLVIGTLNPDLSVLAAKILVLKALEIKPDERKLISGDTATFTVKLRETASADVPVELTVSDPAVITLSVESLTIPKGSNTADFSVAAGSIGTAVITAAALSQTATADVSVGSVSEGDNEHPKGPVRIAFAPDKVKMGLNQTRSVLVLVFPPQKASVAVDYSVKNGLVKILDTRALGSGTALVKLTVQSLATEGSDSIVATLPESLGGGKAELLIEVASKNGKGGHQKFEIGFRPDDLVVHVGDSATVNLLLNHPSDQDISVTLAVQNPANVQVDPATVKFAAGARQAQLTVKGLAEGESTVIATLPDNSSTAKLDVKVKVK